MLALLPFLLLVLATASCFTSSAQNGHLSKTGAIKGRLISMPGGLPATEVQVMLPALKQLTISDAEGNFSFSQLPYGTYSMVIGVPGVHADTLMVYVNQVLADLKNIKVRINDSNAVSTELQIPIVVLEENNISTGDEGLRSGNISGLLSASRDPFLSTISFVFAPYRFQSRGYNRNSQEVQINGNPMNDVETGDTYWALWGGLNDVFRSRSNTYGLQASPYTFGGVGGSVYFDATAAAHRKQTGITWSQTNRSYRSRIAFTKSSGLLQSGWAYSVSVSGRWAKEGHIPGTFYEGYSYYAGLSRRTGDRHEINLVSFGARIRRGKTAPVTAETVEIAGSALYNPAWGYQNGVKRNSRIADNFQPITILDYRYYPSNSLRWRSSIGYQSGKTRNSALDYYNGSNPRPDYYRYLPSYYILSNTDPSDLNPGARAEFHTQQQIDWARIYNENSINDDSILSAEGIAGNIVRGNRSVTVLYNDVEEVRKFSFNSNVEQIFGANVTLNAGIQAIAQRIICYRELTDLLGGDFYLNLNQFAFQQNVPDVSFNQYDLNTPDRPIREGDKYNYHYVSHFTCGMFWLQGVFTYKRIDLFLAARGAYNSFYREGLYRNGLFADVSFGKSDEQQFSTYAFKAGATYKIDGRNYLFVHAGYGQDAPSFDNTFISPRTRNITIPVPTLELIGSIEAGYLLRHPKYNLRAVGYATDIRDAAETRRYYNDDPAFRGFVNYVMQGVSTRYTGLELAAELRLRSSLSVTAVAVIGQAFYTDNPSVAVYRDNDTIRTPAIRKVFIRNFYLAAGPQSAYTLGFNYRAKKYWYAGLNVNLLDRNYVAINPDRRTEEAIAGIEPGGELYDAVLAQERLPKIFTLDVSGGKSWLLSKYIKQIPRSTFLYLNMGISNLLNAGVRTGGFEQLRYDFVGQVPDKFATKYFYGLGRNFFLNLSLKF